MSGYVAPWKRSTMNPMNADERNSDPVRLWEPYCVVWEPVGSGYTHAAYVDGPAVARKLSEALTVAGCRVCGCLGVRNDG